MANRFDKYLVGSGVVDVDFFDGQGFVNFAKYCCVGHFSCLSFLVLLVMNLGLIVFEG